MLTVLTSTIFAILAALPLLALRSLRVSRSCERVAAPFRAIVQAAFAIACASILLLALVQLAVVLAVSVFSVSVIWLQEATTYLFGASFLLAGAGVLLADEHVRVDVFYGRWSERRKAMVDLAGLTLFVLPVCALIVVASTPYVAASWAELERSSEPSGIHAVYFLKSMIPTFAVLLAMAGFVRAVEAARRVRRTA